MEKSKYTEILKNLISAKVKESEGDKNFIDKLFPLIKDTVISIGSSFGLGAVDEKTLESYFEVARKEFLSVNPIDPGISHALTREGLETWLDAQKKDEIEWNYSERYFKYLGKTGRSAKVVEETKRSSLAIMEKLANPKSSRAVYVKGLVVGAVQSGKTGNFNGVINRAIDCGYGLIIVLSGIMEDLRSQTQNRIESDVIGEGLDTDTKNRGKKGVGNIRRFGPMGDSSVTQVNTITSTKSDFSRAIKDADFSLNDINVLVCKKNVSVLKNLIVWLHDYLDKNRDKHDIPLLILDDEADNASLNNAGAKGREYASKTNGHIRALLELFTRKSYLGYTATPFANVLQDRNEAPENPWEFTYRVGKDSEVKELAQVDNIFPDDFIELLVPPTNYVGAKQIFETVGSIDNHYQEKIPLVQVVDDNLEDFPDRVYEDGEGKTIGVENFRSKDEWVLKNGEYGGYLDFATYAEYRSETRSARKEDDFPRQLPVSLQDAIKCFILSLAIRESRKPKMINSALFNPHNTMLIHISRFTFWQNRTKALVQEYINEIIAKIQNDNPSGKDSIYFDLEQVWYRYYASIVENISNYLRQGYADPFMTSIVYDSLKSYLPQAIIGVEVKAINSVTKDKLEYPRNNPKKIIAIGGNRLSRGFTLEGLTINYFVRTTNYSDTLLQMGRWFGYRPGYLDCCKIFTTEDSIDKFNSTTKCIEELEGEFRKMERKGKSPRKFALRVKKHPGTLRITRPSILKNAKDVKWSFQDQLEMTTQFRVEKAKIESVWQSFKENVAPKFDSQIEDFLTFKTSGEGMVELLKLDNNFPEQIVDQMAKFIELCVKNKKLTDWTVALKTNGNAKEDVGKGILFPEESGLSRNVGLVIRRGPKKNDSVDGLSFREKKVFRATGKNANIVSAGRDFSLLLSDSDRTTAELAFRKEKERSFRHKDENLSEIMAQEKAQKVTVPERVYREKMKEHEGLLVIYLLDAYYSFKQERGKEDNEFLQFVKKENINLEIPLVGYAIGFPPIEDDPGGEYMQGDYDLDEDEGNDVDNGYVPDDE